MSARRFAFDTEFAPDGAILSEGGGRRVTPEELDAARTHAFEQGKADAQAAAERAAAAALKQVADAAGALLRQLHEERAAMRAEAAGLALAAARKISGAALASFGEDRALGAIEQTLDMLRSAPRLIVRVAPDKVDALKPRIEALAAEQAFAGAILVRPDPRAGAGAVSIDWGDGAVTLDPAEADARITDLVTAALAGAREGAQP